MADARTSAIRANTEDEREALANLIPLGFRAHDGVRNVGQAADRILAAGFRRQAPQVTRDELEALIQRVDDEEMWSNIFPEEGRQIADALLAEFDITRKAP